MRYYIKKHTKQQICHHRRKKAECCQAHEEEPVVPWAFDLLIAPYFFASQNIDYGYADRTSYIEVGPKDNINVGDQVVDAYNLISPHNFFINAFNTESQQVAPINPGDPSIQSVTWTWDYNDELGNSSPNLIPYNGVAAGLDSIRANPPVSYAAVSYSTSETVPLGHTISTDTNTWQPLGQVTLTDQPILLINWEKIFADQKTILLTLKCEVEFNNDENDPPTVETVTARMPYIFRWDGGPQLPPSAQLRKGYIMSVDIPPAGNIPQGTYQGFINPTLIKNAPTTIEYGQFEIEEGVFLLTEESRTTDFVVHVLIDALSQSYDIESITVNEYRGYLPDGVDKPVKATPPNQQQGWDSAVTELTNYVKGTNDANLTLFKASGLSLTLPNFEMGEDWCALTIRLTGRVNKHFFDTTFIHYYYTV